MVIPLGFEPKTSLIQLSYGTIAKSGAKLLLFIVISK